MAGKKHVALNNSTNVIPVQWDATYFFERAVRSLDRYHYEKALKYFRRAVEYEPENPVNHCNTAGILSEMGRYEESNRILSWIINELDPSMTECHFYMANNFANMDMFLEAESSLVEYLQEDPEGHYLSEAEEMMELLQSELERPARLTKIKARGGLAEHDRARYLLEEGKFNEAVRMLEQIAEEHPEFYAARNNLALAYYYMGLFSKALETVEEVLKLDAGNMHALCNLAIFYQHKGELDQLLPLMERLCKVEPFHEEHLFKLATTMGILGRHETAHRHFYRLLKHPDFNHDPCLYHYAAVAACNIGRFTEAEKLWKQTMKLDPASVIPGYYLEQLSLVRSGVHKEALSYHYHLPFEEQFKQWEQSAEGIPEHIKTDPFVRSSFFWALRHGDMNTKLQVLQAFGMIGDEEVQEVIRDFLLEANEDDYLKKIALFVLRTLGVQEPLKVVLGGKEIITGPNRLPSMLPIWEDKWEEVSQLAMAGMDGRYDLVQQHDMMTLWVEFLSKLYPDIPKLQKPEGWAGALEYWTAKMHNKAVSYHEVSLRYDVSISTVSKHAKLIEEVCGIKAKMESVNSVFASHELAHHEE